MLDRRNLYLESLLPDNEKYKEMETYAAEFNIPIIDRVSMQFLAQLASIHCAKDILEIGTAIGYSAIKLATALPSAHITTLERDNSMIEAATHNFLKWEMEARIKLMRGDASDNLHLLKKKGQLFDFVFIDAAKSQYESFFNSAAQLLQDNGIIVCDNVLFRGYAADPDRAPSKRLNKLAGKINNFNHWLSANETYDTSIIPVGDGMAISRKRV